MGRRAKSWDGDDVENEVGTDLVPGRSLPLPTVVEHEREVTEGTSALRRATVRAYMAYGLDLAEIVDETGWPLAEVERLYKTILLDEEREVTTVRSDSVYTRYVVEQNHRLRQLEEIVRLLKKDGKLQGVALVGAIKAQHEIATKTLVVGQDMGFVEKRPMRVEHLHGHVIADMGNKELQDFLGGLLRETMGLSQHYGDVDLLDSPDVNTRIPKAIAADVVVAPKSARPQATRAMLPVSRCTPVDLDDEVVDEGPAAAAPKPRLSRRLPSYPMPGAKGSAKKEEASRPRPKLPALPRRASMG